MDRKEFLLSTCALCGFGIAASLMDGCSKAGAPVVNFTLNLNDAGNAALHSVGGYVIANGGNTIVMNTSSGYKALSLICTHNGCTVAYYGAATGFICPCHGGTYNASGQVTGGPPPSPLASYNVAQSANILTITG